MSSAKGASTEPSCFGDDLPTLSVLGARSECTDIPGGSGRSLIHFMPIPRVISFFSVANKGIHSMGERPLVNACRPRVLRTLSPYKRRQMCTYKPLGTRSRGQNRRLLSQRACRLRAARLETSTRAHPHNQVTRREATALES